jgi:hypothetical protein
LPHNHLQHRQDVDEGVAVLVSPVPAARRL